MSASTGEPQTSPSWFPLGDEERLSPAIRELYARCREKLGFVPNVFVAYQWRPERLAAFLAHYDAVMAPTETLGAAERELIAVAVSMANGCSYCLVAHGYSVRKLLRDPVGGDLATLDHRRAPLTERQRAMLDYAVKLTRTPVECERADLDALRAHGLSDEDLWDVAEVAALFNFTNRMAHATGMRPNPEYHGMAR
jgi:uncharacterized peroxidase-related enzyme